MMNFILLLVQIEFLFSTMISQKCKVTKCLLHRISYDENLLTKNSYFEADVSFSRELDFLVSFSFETYMIDYNLLCKYLKKSNSKSKLLSREKTTMILNKNSDKNNKNMLYLENYKETQAKDANHKINYEDPKNIMFNDNPKIGKNTHKTQNLSNDSKSSSGENICINVRDLPLSTKLSLHKQKTSREASYFGFSKPKEINCLKNQSMKIETLVSILTEDEKESFKNELTRFKEQAGLTFMIRRTSSKKINIFNQIFNFNIYNCIINLEKSFFIRFVRLRNSILETENISLSYLITDSCSFRDKTNFKNFIDLYFLNKFTKDYLSKSDNLFSTENTTMNVILERLVSDFNNFFDAFF